MSATFEPLGTGGVLLVTPAVHGDDRGFFLERYKRSAYLAHGVGSFVQDNHSRSEEGVLRGLHWQIPPHGQGKLVSVLRGEILDAAVDLRRGSATFGRWVSAVLNDRTHQQMWIPEGFAHGFAVLRGPADVLYKATAEYAREAERGVAWNDPELGVGWGVRDPRVSDRDAALPLLRDLDDSDLFAEGCLAKSDLVEDAWTEGSDG